MVAPDAEGRLAVPEDLDLARFVGLDPDHGLGLADVAQQRSEHEFGHRLPLPGEHVLRTPSHRLAELGQALAGRRRLGVKALGDPAGAPGFVSRLDRPSHRGRHPLGVGGA